ncbi:PEP/pyruvate-binding domain-containing protein [Aeromicrobium sp.]|uniref:PEP/pyruvate-binding domain-containing protein n=1 Tax=Aeromicrobium sp. TaxID=1871063 RepID=UPI003C392199
MSEIVALSAATDPARFGGKAVQLGAAIRAGLPTPDGVAMSCVASAAVADGHIDMRSHLVQLVGSREPLAVRSSAVGEDSAAASFAGTHLSELGVRGDVALFAAVCDVVKSGADPGARAYRERMDLCEAGMAVVVQQLIDAEVAGVMFTRNPVSGADERVIEASWGLGEVVVSGLVTPDRFVLDTRGELREAQAGEKDLAIRIHETCGVEAVTITGSLVTQPCLSGRDLIALHQLALLCDTVFDSRDHDIEFAFRAGELFLLQRRPITHG